MTSTGWPQRHPQVLEAEPDPEQEPAGRASLTQAQRAHQPATVRPRGLGDSQRPHREDTHPQEDQLGQGGLGQCYILLLQHH